LFSAPPVKSQAIDKVEIKLELKNESLVKAFQKIEKQSQFQFMYRYADVKDINKLELSAEKMSIADILKELLVNTSLDFKQVDNRIMIVNNQRVGFDGNSIKLKGNDVSKQLDIIVRGQVKDAKGETLPGVSVKVKGTTAGASTDMDGRYSINVDENVVLVFTYIGYVTKEDAAPEVGAVMIVGSYSARSYSHQDYWQTTRVTEIVESWTEAFGNHEIEYIRFRTGNSEYIWSKG
jgi:iron complex outermembrane receptor protein